MNKILIDGDKIFLSKKITNIEVTGQAKLFINNIDHYVDLTITLKNGAYLEVLDYSRNGIVKNIRVIQDSNTTMEYVHSLDIDSEYTFNYITELNGDNNTNKISISGISRGIINLDVNALVRGQYKNNVLEENIKVLNIEGKCKILPKLGISSRDVIANHNTAISNIDDDTLFYLMSKGITNDAAVKLICDGYLYGSIRKYDEEFYNLIKE